MKNLLSTTLALASALVVASCTGQPFTQDDLVLNNTPRVILEVIGQPPKLEIARDSTVECAKNAKGRGCIESPRNNQVIANFSLRRSEGWQFSRFEICAGGEKAPQKCGLGLFGRLEYAAFVRQNGKLAVPGTNGRIRLGVLGRKVRQFSIANQNSVTQNYYYRVEVCRDEAIEAQMKAQMEAQMEAQMKTQMKADPYTDDDGGPAEAAPGCLWNEDPRWQNRGRY